MPPPLRIGLIYPPRALALAGNRVTAKRWTGILRGLGHRVHLADQYDGRPFDVLIVLHARRGAKAAALYHRLYPERPLLVAMTGTDLYRDIGTSAAAQRSLEIASRLIVLQPEGIEALPPDARAKARVIVQSAVAPSNGKPPREKLRVCVLGNLRSIKDPLRAAMAARYLPADSRITIVHAGRALDARYERRAYREMERNARYRWIGEVSHGRARRLLASSHLMVLSSRSEGGANVVSEALAAGVPILGSDIAGTRGILGSDYPGLFPVGETRALTALLERVERDPAFYARLRRRCRRLAPLVKPERERKAWRELLAEITQPRQQRPRR